MNFANFKTPKNFKPENATNSNKNRSAEFIGKEDEGSIIAQEKLRSTYDELKNLDSDSLSQRLAEEVSRQKGSGTFDYASLSSSVEAMRQYLPSETYQNLKNLLEKIK